MGTTPSTEMIPQLLRAPGLVPQPRALQIRNIDPELQKEMRRESIQLGLPLNQLLARMWASYLYVQKELGS